MESVQLTLYKEGENKRNELLALFRLALGNFAKNFTYVKFFL